MKCPDCEEEERKQEESTNMDMPLISAFGWQVNSRNKFFNQLLDDFLHLKEEDEYFLLI